MIISSLKPYMAQITPGTGATITAPTAEGQLMAVVHFIRAQEANLEKNPTGRQSVTGSFNIVSLLFTGTFELLFDTTITATGTLEIKCRETLSGVTFTPGTGGTFKSAAPMGYLSEVLQYLQTKELNPTINSDGTLNNITDNFSSDTQILSGTFALPVDFALNAGEVKFTVVPYLS